MIVLSGLCIFLTIIIGIMAAMALAARGIAEENRKEAERAESEKDKE